ncbi:MAG: MFS transporter [Symbiobacteriia bacterium]
MHYLQNVYRRYSPTLWVLALSRLIDMTTFWMAWPFISLFLKRAGASVTSTGLVLALPALASLLGNLIGGQLSDVHGRKPVLLSGMAIRVFVLAGYAFAGHIWQFAILGFANGLMNALFQPAFTAVVADVTPPAKRPEAFGLARVASNLGVGVGPLLGGLLGVRHQELIFLIAAISSGLAWLLILWRVPETLPGRALRGRPAAGMPEDMERVPGYRPKGPAQVLRAWATIFQDRALLIFVLAGTLSTLAYQQINSTYALTLMARLPNYDKVYGAIWAINGLLVVLLQLPITFFFERFPMAIAAFAGPLTFSLGYLLFAAAAVAASPPYIMLAAAVWTMGEIILAVPQSTFAADIAPETARVRYAGASSLPWGIAGVLGPIVGTSLMGIIGGPAVISSGAGLALLAGFLFVAAERGRTQRLAELEATTGRGPAIAR